MTKLTILSKGIRTLDNLYSLNDLHKASGNAAKHQPSRFLRLDTTQELIAEIVSYPDLGSTHKVENGKGTWVCKELVYAYAMWISARFHLQVIHAFRRDHKPTAICTVRCHSHRQTSPILTSAFSQFDELKARHGESYRQYQTMQQQINMMRSFCDHMESELKTFRSQVDAEVDAINHINLYKGMVLEYQGADELKRFIEQKH